MCVCHTHNIVPYLLYNLIYCTLQSNHLALVSAIESYKSWQPASGHVNSVSKLPHVVTTNIEHPAIDLPLRQWKKEGTISELNHLTIYLVSPSVFFLCANFEIINV